MEELIEKLLSECEYLKKSQGISYFTKEEKSFFFLLSIPEEMFGPLRNNELIKQDLSYRKVLDGFKSIINSGEQIAIEKNSSLIILVKCADIGAIKHLQQQIMLFEEDEYFFKKYVILFTDAAIEQLRILAPLLPELRVKVNNEIKFSEFASGGYLPALAEYLVVLQLFIKLPFLNLDHSTESFIPLSQKIAAILESKHSLYTSLLQKTDDLMQIDYTKPETEDRINELLNDLPND